MQIKSILYYYRPTVGNWNEVIKNVRVMKEPEERKSEILDTAQQLFYTKGYTQTTINDILKKIGIAKGTFYYYFKSKEEVMHAIIDRIVDHDLAVAKQIAQDENLSVNDKFLKILISQGQNAKPETGKQELTEEFHKPGNEIIHQQTLSIIIRRLSPILAEVTRDGIEQGLFHVTKVQETIEFLLAGAEFIFDIGLFEWTEEEQRERVLAFLELTENALGAEKNSFSYLMPIFIK